MVDRGLARPLQHSPVGQRLLRGQRQGRPDRAAGRRGRARSRPQGPGRRGAPPRHRPAAADPLLRDPQGPRARAQRVLPRAITEYGYQGTYRGVYPIKVNQEAYVVERLVDAGRPYHFGLEAGSKPELLAVLAMLEDEEAIVICNGYKDEEYVETALLASKLGLHVILVVEKFSELALIAERRREDRASSPAWACARACRRAAPGTGRPPAATARSSASARAASLEAVDFLRRPRHARLPAAAPLPPRQPDLLDPQHQGGPARGGAHVYVELPQLGAPLGYLDVGGGLGVDYDGSQTNFSSSMNYSLAGVRQRRRLRHHGAVRRRRRAPPDHRLGVRPRPGRPPLGAGRRRARRRRVPLGALPEVLPEGTPAPIRNLFDAYRELSRKNLLEAYHDASELPRRGPVPLQLRPPLARPSACSPRTSSGR